MYMLFLFAVVLLLILRTKFTLSDNVIVLVVRCTTRLVVGFVYLKLLLLCSLYNVLRCSPFYAVTQSIITKPTRLLNRGILSFYLHTVYITCLDKVLFVHISLQNRYFNMHFSACMVTKLLQDYS